MGPFLTIHRQEIVDLPVPWDPSRVIREYVEHPDAQRELPLTQDQLSTLLNDGVVVRLDARHRWMGAMEGEMRIAVLDPSTVEINIDGWATLRWWLRPFALPFRGRMRRAVEAQIDKLIEELEAGIQEADIAADEPLAEHEADLGPEPPPRHEPEHRSSGLGGLVMRLRVLTIGGELIYQQQEGGPPSA